MNPSRSLWTCLGKHAALDVAILISRALSCLIRVLYLGRKLRYHVLPKLENFLAPDPEYFPSTDAARDDLCSSMFGGTPETSTQ